MADEDKVADVAAALDVPDRYEDEAKGFGWKPPEDFSGEGHMSAESFMLKGPGTSRKLSAEVQEQKKAIGQLTQAMTDQKAGFQRMEAAQKDNMEDRIEARAEVMAKYKREVAETGEM